MNEILLMKKLEGMERRVYRCTANKISIGVGFNMDAAGAEDTWNILDIVEDFDRVLQGKDELSVYSATRLFNHVWTHCVVKAMARAGQLGLDWSSFNKYKQFVLADIVYNTGSISNWSQVLKETENKKVMIESRRKQRELDSRVAKIAHYYSVVSSLEEAIEDGLTEAKYIS